MLSQQSVQQFLDALASASPTPGGGGAAALTTAMAAALVAMTANLTIGKPQYAAVEAEMRDLLARAEAIRAEATALIQGDADAYNGVMAAYALPRGTDEQKRERSAAIQAALRAACQPPLHLATLARAVIELSVPAAEHGNANVVSDAVAAAHLAYAGLEAARLNVEINLKAIKDPVFVEQQRAVLDSALVGAAERVLLCDVAMNKRG
ncbi:MAG: cyclodeaminase/cyclohydrolase family protein [Dehalococcoidia bacterium]|nr:cyclodeaminase/cyclohydrolase family protein [Dehalococcoidia bacterium]